MPLRVRETVASLVAREADASSPRASVRSGPHLSKRRVPSFPGPGDPSLELWPARPVPEPSFPDGGEGTCVRPGRGAAVEPAVPVASALAVALRSWVASLAASMQLQDFACKFFPCPPLSLSSDLPAHQCMLPSSTGPHGPSTVRLGPHPTALGSLHPKKASSSKPLVPSPSPSFSRAHLADSRRIL